MKKVLLMAIASLVLNQTNAQISLPKTADVTKAATSAVGSFIAPPKLGDVTGTTNSVVDKLTSQLSLPASQKKCVNRRSGWIFKAKARHYGFSRQRPFRLPE